MDNYDLPLLSNINQVIVKHYLIELHTNFQDKSLSGSLILFCESTPLCKDNDAVERFPVILECSDVIVESVKELLCKNNLEFSSYVLSRVEENDQGDFIYWCSHLKKEISFTQDAWSLRIQSESLFCNSDFPKALFIKYKTKPEGGSIAWRKLDDGTSCFFTCGSSLNNRSLLPCQDRPTAMATWQSWIYVPKDHIVSMTGDEEPLVTHVQEKDFICYYFFTSMIVPIATIAIAVGQWERIDLITQKESIMYKKKLVEIQPMESTHSNMECKHVNYRCHFKRNASLPKAIIPVSLLVPLSVQSKAKILFQFTKNILLTTYRILGNYPFQRLQFVILPRCFSSLGLSSPNVIYLSQSVLIDDSFFHIRLAHEISHSWFGITIGPKNWQEEWISEGFATYLEDIIYVLAKWESEVLEHDVKTESFLAQLSHYEEFFSIRAYNRYKLLLSEQENSNEELQILSPNSDTSQQTLANSLNPEKSFLQVHYLKGYFLLDRLSRTVSRPLFLRFICTMVHKFHGQLVTSQDILNYFFETFPSAQSEISKTAILQEWLSKPEINSDIVNNFNNLSLNKYNLMKTVNDHTRFWRNAMKLSSFTCNSDFQVFQKRLIENSMIVYSDQLVLILEDLLNIKDKIPSKLINKIYSFYNISQTNPEVLHRWFELIIKNGCSRLNDLRNYLVEHQSMGVYLYGELIISGKKSHLKLVNEIYQELKDELDVNARKVIFSMIHGEE